MIFYMAYQNVDNNNNTVPFHACVHIYASYQPCLSEVDMIHSWIVNNVKAAVGRMYSMAVKTVIDWK